MPFILSQICRNAWAHLQRDFVVSLVNLSEHLPGLQIALIGLQKPCKISATWDPMQGQSMFSCNGSVNELPDKHVQMLFGLQPAKASSKLIVLGSRWTPGHKNSSILTILISSGMSACPVVPFLHHKKKTAFTTEPRLLLTLPMQHKQKLQQCLRLW